VILEVEPQFRESPDLLDKIYVKSSSGQPVPLSAFATMHVSNTPLSIPHQGQFPAATISFNLQSGSSLSHAIPAFKKQNAKSVCLIQSQLHSPARRRNFVHR
jgi:multidrug efflux pump subunit AcrB